MAGEHIVVIDDDPDIREALTLILSPLGYRLTCCATGPGGLAAIRASRPDLVLLDIMLASPSEGFHLARELRGDPATAGIPIIMISAIGRTLGMDYAKEMGGEYVSTEAFLDKPLRPDVLLQTLWDILARRKG
jgi:CheY-like chemotaxis protein